MSAKKYVRLPRELFELASSLVIRPSDVGARIRGKRKVWTRLKVYVALRECLHGKPFYASHPTAKEK